MVELRKRPAPKETAAPAPAAKRSASKGGASVKSKQVKPTEAALNNSKKNKEEVKDTPKSALSSKESEPKSKAEGESKAGTTAPETTSSSSKQFPLSTESVSKTIPLAPLSSEITLHTSNTTTLAKLLSHSQKGIIIFSYPKASTPGCTTQACAFRDSFSDLKDAGYTVYGLSNDSPKANTTFVTKQKLSYELICDTEGVLSGPLGLKKAGNAKGCVRGVVLLQKQEDNETAAVGVWFLGGPQKTLDACLDFISK